VNVAIRHGGWVSSAGENEPSNVDQVQWDERYIVTPNEGHDRPQTEVYASFMFVNFSLK